MFKIKNLLIISLFITMPAFAAEKSFMQQIREFADLLLKGAINAPGNLKGKEGFSDSVFSKIDPIDPVNTTIPVSSLTDKSKELFRAFNEGCIKPGCDLTQRGWNHMQEGIDAVSENIVDAAEIVKDVAELGVEFGVQKATELTNVVNNNRWKAAAIASSTILACILIKNALKSKKNNRNDGKSIIYYNGDIRRDAATVAMIAGSAYGLYKTKTIIDWVTKKVS